MRPKRCFCAPILGYISTTHNISSAPGSSPSPTTIALTDYAKKRRVQVVGLDESPAVFSLASETPQPEERALAAEQEDEMHALVNQLEVDYRTPLVLRYWNECSYQEIADIMGISEGAVKSRLFRARKKLASLYEMAENPVINAQVPVTNDPNPQPLQLQFLATGH